MLSFCKLKPKKLGETIERLKSLWGGCRESGLQVEQLGFRSFRNVTVLLPAHEGRAGVLTGREKPCCQWVVLQLL